MSTAWHGRTLAAGRARGRALVLDQPLSLWGGMDPHDGRVLDRNHPQCGQVLTGRVVLMASGRGSSSSPSVLAEAIRLGTAPCALVLGATDPMVALGAVAAAELYDLLVPVVVVAPLPRVASGALLEVTGTAPGGPATLRHAG